MNEEQLYKLQKELDFIIEYINDNLDDTPDIKNCFDRIECISKKLRKQCYHCNSLKVKYYCKKIKIFFCRECYKTHIKPNLKNKKSFKKLFFN